MNFKYYLPFFVSILVLVSCKKQINNQVIKTATNYLVVSGNITPGDTTVINLSRMLSVNDTAASKAEPDATVTIEGSQGGVYLLTSKNNGNYVSVPLNLPSAQNYRVKIITSDGKQYASDFVPLKNSPAIDSVNYVVNYNSGVQINVNTHDANNNTHYYRWDYAETYVIHSAFESHYMEVNHDTTAIRPADQEIYQCWANDISSSILTGSSVALSKDLIRDQLLTEIPSNSEKLHIRYSIQVQQYALTADAFNYFNLLKKNTEQLGGIFDPQPSELTGNVHCLSNVNEPVVGYITAGAVSKMRIFIDSSQLPSWIPATPYGGCTADTLLYIYVEPVSNPTIPPIITNQVAEFIYKDIEIPLDQIIGGYTASFPQCVDCTLRGTNKQPAFWK